MHGIGGPLHEAASHSKEDALFTSAFPPNGTRFRMGPTDMVCMSHHAKGLLVRKSGWAPINLVVDHYLILKGPVKPSNT